MIQRYYQLTKTLLTLIKGLAFNTSHLSAVPQEQRRAADGAPEVDQRVLPEAEWPHMKAVHVQFYILSQPDLVYL